MKKCAITGKPIERGVVVDPAALEKLKADNEYEKLKAAFYIACTEVAEHQCPYEYDEVYWEECKTCKKDTEFRYDAARDINCFMRYYFEQATELVENTRRCRVCGCTEFNACQGGCYWVEPDLCSSCAEKGVQK